MQVVHSRVYALIGALLQVFSKTDRSNCSELHRNYAIYFIMCYLLYYKIAHRNMYRYLFTIIFLPPTWALNSEFSLYIHSHYDASRHVATNTHCTNLISLFLIPHSPINTYYLLPIHYFVIKGSYLIYLRIL